MISYVFQVEAEENAELSSSKAYQMYSALLNLLPVTYGDQLHTQTLTPIAQYLQVNRREESCLWRVSLLDAEAERYIVPVLEKLNYLQIGRTTVSVQIVKRICIRTGEEMIRRGERMHGRNGETWICFRTPTSFKLRERMAYLPYPYVPYPTPELVLGNLLHRWNAYFPESSRSRECLQDLWSGLVLQDYSLRAEWFPLKGSSIPAFRGEVCLRIDEEAKERKLLQGLVAMSAFTGIGIKTALGMGGTQVRWDVGRKDR